MQGKLSVQLAPAAISEGKCHTKGSSILQVLPSSSSGHGSPSEHSGSHQLLTAIKVWVSSQCLCCAWSYAAFTERKKTKPKLKSKD